MDNVNHPKHYEGSTSLECIQVMEIMFGPRAVADFCMCNAFKYLWRYKNKNGSEDLDKAVWYCNYVIYTHPVADTLTQEEIERVSVMLRSICDCKKKWIETNGNT